MRGIWTVARQTLAQILRTKTAWVFILVLAAFLVVLPGGLQGDGTLAGRIRAYLSYSTTIIALTLSVLTVFLAVDVVSSDVRNRTVFSVVTKPVGRWQYVLGRWLGVVLLDALLLAVAAADVYVVAQSMRRERTSADDPLDGLAVESEVFTARARIAPVSIDDKLTARVRARIAKFREENPTEFERELGARGGARDEQAALDAYYREIYKQESQKSQTVGPFRSMRWDFENIELAGQPATGTVKVTEVIGQVGTMWHVRFGGPDSLIRKLVYRGPVQVGGAEAQVRDLTEGFVAAFMLDDAGENTKIGRLDVGDTIDVRLDPTLQLSFKARSAGGKLPGGKMKTSWTIRNRTGPVTVYYVNRSDPPRMIRTLVVPGRAVDDNSEMTVQVLNLNPASLRILRDDVSVLYRVGSFEGNFFRVMVLVLGQLMFLAALGVMAGSFLSFPVACVLAFGVLPFSLGRQFLTESVKLPRGGGLADADPITAVGHIILKVMGTILPDFNATNRGDALVDGMSVAWSEVASSMGLAVCVPTVVLLALAMLIFTKRELAGVQVA